MSALRTLLCLVLMHCFAFALSQASGQTEGLRYRETRRAVLELLENYDKHISRESVHDIYELQKLFTDSNAKIANDILMENMLDESLTLTEYENRRDKYHSYRMIHQKSMAIKKLGALNYTSANSGSLDVVVSREIQWSMKKQADFIYVDTLVQVFRVDFDQRESGVICKIAFISNTIVLGKHLLLRAACQQNKNFQWLINDSLLVNGRAFTTDQNGYIQIKRLQADEVIKIKTLNPEFHQTKKVSPSSMKASIGFSELNFRLPKWSFEVQGGFMPLGYRSIQANNYTSNSQYDYLIGLSLGQNIKRTAKWEWLAKLNISQSWHKTLLGTPNISYNYNAFDFDNFEYVRQITISNFVEQFNVEITAVGLGLGVSYKLNPHNALQAEFGYQQVANQKTMSIRTANGLFGGNYPELFGVTIFENGIYDFGNFEIAETNAAMNTNISGLGTFQLRMSTKLSRTSSVQYGLFYRHATIGIQNNAQQLRLSSAPNHLNSLLQTSKAGEVQFINFILGYQYKF